MKKRFLPLPLLLLTACVEPMAYPGQLDKQAAVAAQSSATPVDQIALTQAATINGGRYKELGQIEASVGKVTAFHPTPSVADAEKKLRIEAAELGADAVINAKIGAPHICPLSWSCRDVSGTAVALPK
ncbi:hypothetical protein CEW89_04020 [Celeribacter ethanolicus]|uniref:Lipoprotein n=1 Tax=Celeribacter ethanolicus TaxID=1758178 RepID=A0A291G9F7_9RHOB|nr:hypothetical protein [Celeribacter ethanolicus]ATG46797.1 hypothetical protein CEW89_04020 [Celeribacter ethanolicus]TNE67271.1 MAG: hypothetical protein EP336_08275 [Paracoccaceae bacterium]